METLKQLELRRNELRTKVKELLSIKEELFGDVDIESPMSLKEKELNKEISSIFSEINKIIRQKNKIKRSVNL